MMMTGLLARCSLARNLVDCYCYDGCFQRGQQSAVDVQCVNSPRFRREKVRISSSNSPSKTMTFLLRIGKLITYVLRRSPIGYLREEEEEEAATMPVVNHRDILPFQLPKSSQAAKAVPFEVPVLSLFGWTDQSIGWEACASEATLSPPLSTGDGMV
ncbi:hypothetical protein BGZ63DRAFT_437031 [Mariannaea sp. PMI_226]|nr:hypothetical protein BGZ63DRAFT_437031 [Mariannaea sp. PMI_226]